MNSFQNILYLINPLSGDGTSLKNWRKAASKFSMLPDYPIDITTIKDLKKYINEASPDLIVIAGGDGTINSVTSAIYEMRKKPSLAILPFGTGNALSYCLGVETLEKAMDVLARNHESIPIDIVKTNLPNHPVCVFNMSVGFDARVVHTRHNFSYIGLRSYILFGIHGYINHEEEQITFTIDGKTSLSSKASCLMIANCPIIGQNYLVSPSARLNDGFLDCTLFSTKYAYITNLRFWGFKHPLYSDVGKVHFKAKKLKIHKRPLLQIDGDPIVYKDDIEIEILPKHITFLRNAKLPTDYMPFEL